MKSMDEIERQLFADGYERRPYGYRRKFDDIVQKDGTLTCQLIVIESKKNTAMGADPASLNQYGLRGHSGEVWEFVEHHGNFDGTNDKEDSLLYRRLEGSSMLKDVTYKRGVGFYSVFSFAYGYWHYLANISDKPIRLIITAQLEPKHL